MVVRRFWTDNGPQASDQRALVKTSLSIEVINLTLLFGLHCIDSFFVLLSSIIKSMLQSSDFSFTFSRDCELVICLSGGDSETFVEFLISQSNFCNINQSKLTVKFCRNFDLSFFCSDLGRLFIIKLTFKVFFLQGQFLDLLLKSNNS